MDAVDLLLFGFLFGHELLEDVSGCVEEMSWRGVVVVSGTFIAETSESAGVFPPWYLLSFASWSLSSSEVTLKVFSDMMSDWLRRSFGSQVARCFFGYLSSW